MSKRAKSEGSIYRRGDGWVAMLHLGYDGNGARLRRALYADTEAEALEKMEKFKANRANGLNVDGGKETMATFLRGWLEASARPRLRARTFISYQMIVERHLIPALGRVKLTALEPKHVRGYKNAKLAGSAKEKPLSARSVAYHFAILRAALREAKGDRRIIFPATEGVKPPKVERREMAWLNAGQAREFLAGVAGDRLATLYALAVGVGARQGELCGLTWPAIDFDAGTLTIKATLQYYGGAYHLDKPKTAKSTRTIALPASLVDALRARRIDWLAEKEALLKKGIRQDGELGDLVFTREDGSPISGTQLTRGFQTILKRLGLPRARFHDLRHSCASLLLAEGVDLKTISVTLGHATIGVTGDYYAHIEQEGQRSDLELLSARLSGR